MSKKLDLSTVKVNSFVTSSDIKGGHDYPTCDCSLPTGFICEVACTEHPLHCR